MSLTRIQVIDSHTGGEPTRVIIAGGPPLGGGSLAQRRDIFRSQFDHFRSAVVNEPRGSDAMVGALICEPCDPECAAGVIFFNNAGYLGMCGHGTIGLGVTLAHLGRVGTGVHRIETPVGVVSMEIHGLGEITIENVRSYRAAKDIAVNVEGFGAVRGDVAWGGNWFFLSEDIPCELELGNLEMLTDYSWKIRQALGRPEVDHIELMGPARDSTCHARNFVLCPGKAYDRSPCGTGTSAKLACLYADGKLRAGKVWRQESITGSVFEGSVVVRGGEVFPRIRGSAFVNAQASLIVEEQDPLRWGIRI
jgi:4-hydroxyproline epimerase